MQNTYIQKTVPNVSEIKSDDNEETVSYLKQGVPPMFIDGGKPAEEEQKKLLSFLEQFHAVDSSEKEELILNLKKWVSSVSDVLEKEVLELLWTVDPEKPKIFKNKDFKADVSNAFEKLDTTAFEALINAFQPEEEGSNSYNMVNLKTVVEQLVLFKTILPDVKPYYAIKCSPDPLIVRTLCWLNAGFDCASWNEIDQVHNEMNKLRKYLLQIRTKSDKESKNGLLEELPMNVTSSEPKNLTNENQKMISLFNKYLLDINYNSSLQCDSVQEMFSRLEHGTVKLDGLEGSTMEQRKIVYAHPCKLKNQMKQAMDITVGYTTFDNMMEIEKISKIQTETGKKLKVLLRIATHDENSKFSFSTKYGAPLDTVDELIKKCFDLGVEIVGCSFHTGTGCPTPQPYITALQDCKDIFEKVRKFTNNTYDPKVVDIGGGFWRHSLESFFTIANPLRPIIADLFPKSEGYRVTAEPGRFFATRCTTLVTEVYSIREIHPNEPNNPEKLTAWCYLNDSMYHSLNNINFDSYIFNPIVWRKEPREKGTFRYRIFGCTCDSLDVICKCWETDEALGEGDIMFYPNFGAYTVSCSTRFNGFETCPSKYLFI